MNASVLANQKQIHRFPKFDQFRTAVDAALSRCPPQEGKYVTYTEAFEEIRSFFEGDRPKPLDACAPTNGHISSELGVVSKEILLSSVLVGTPEEPYYSIAQILRDAMRACDSAPIVNPKDDRWIDAIHIAHAYLQRRSGGMGSEPAGLKAPTITFAQAVHFFNNKGMEVGLTGDTVMIDSSRVWATLAATISTPLKAMGDTRAMKYVDDALSSRFDPIIQRFHLHPTPDMMGWKMVRSLPYGHLYRVALSILGTARSAGGANSRLEAIGEAATHFAALYEVEPFSTYEITLPPYPARIVEYLRDVVLYDELFSIPQCDPAPMERLLRELFSDACGTAPIGGDAWTFEHAIVLWQLLIEAAPRTGRCSFVSRKHLKNRLLARVGRKACDELLRAFVLNGPNRRYHTPHDAHFEETRECAIAHATADRYWVAARPLLGPAFFSRLVTCCATADKEISRKIGDAFESRMLSRMTSLGIQARRVEVLGTAKREKGGDIDLLLETDQIIGLFEIKKKGLTRRTSTGDELQMLLDLSRGLIRGVNQLARHELSLLRSGELRFSDGTTLRHDGRDILKGVISLSDYGGLHDGATLRNVLQSFCQVTLNSNAILTQQQRDELEEVTKQIKTLQDHNNAFNQMVQEHIGDHGRSLFDNLVFHNVFFVEHVLLSVRSATDFLTTLRMRNRIITGSRDQIFEFEQFNGLRA